MINREDYLNGKATHDEYYAQFLSNGLVNAVVNRIGADRIKNSTDKHFNDIPLILWDQMRCLVEMYCGKSISLANGNGKPFGVSLSDCVCVAKRAAKEYKVKSCEQQ